MSITTHTSQPSDPITEDQRREDARVYVHQRRVFHVHAAVEVTSMVIIVIVNLATNMAAGIASYWWAWWSIWAVLGCGLAVAIHGMVVLMANPRRSGSMWEDRQVNNVLASQEA